VDGLSARHGEKLTPALDDRCYQGTGLKDQPAGPPHRFPKRRERSRENANCGWPKLRRSQKVPQRLRGPAVQVHVNVTWVVSPLVNSAPVIEGEKEN